MGYLLLLFVVRCIIRRAYRGDKEECQGAHVSNKMPDGEHGSSTTGRHQNTLDVVKGSV